MAFGQAETRRSPAADGGRAAGTAGAPAGAAAGGGRGAGDQHPGRRRDRAPVGRGPRRLRPRRRRQPLPRSDRRLRGRRRSATATRGWWRRCGGRRGRLLHGLGDVYAHPLRVELAARLARLAPVAAAKNDRRQVYFAISGAEAVEIALKTALLATGRPAIVAFEPAYHGVTLGALAVTSRAGVPAALRPLAQPARPTPPLRRRSRLGGDRPLRHSFAAAAVAAGALIVEPIAGREGVLLPPPGWLAAVAAACRRHRVLLIADEVFTGFGRTGRLFAVDHEGVRPDLLVCGKALGGGLPIAAVLGRRSLLARLANPRRSPPHRHLRRQPARLRRRPGGSRRTDNAPPPRPRRPPRHHPRRPSRHLARPLPRRGLHPRPRPPLGHRADHHHRRPPPPSPKPAAAASSS